MQIDDLAPAGLPIIDLTLNQLGLIIFWVSGVIYHNQTCGHACMQRYAEGVLVLPTDPVLVSEKPHERYECPIEPLLKAMAWESVSGITDRRATEVDALLKSQPMTTGILVDRTRLRESEEAWVYVTIEPRDNAVYQGFGSAEGVLVWQNSD
jgi:hypothetical protein